jgi:hypothetical protein
MMGTVELDLAAEVLALVPQVLDRVSARSRSSYWPGSRTFVTFCRPTAVSSQVKVEAQHVSVLGSVESQVPTSPARSIPLTRVFALGRARLVTAAELTAAKEVGGAGTSATCTLGA